MKVKLVKTHKILRGLVFFLLLCSSCNEPKDRETITIAAAANMQFVLEELTQKFTEDTGIPCHLVIGSSGKLTAQIVEGAPYDIFVSANMKYPKEIAANGLALTVPEVYAYGRMVLWTLDSSIRPDIEQLEDDAVTHIAIANPRTAPYGRAATEILEQYNLYDSLKPKLVYGESISQTNQFISSGAAEIGFTAMSVVLSSEMKGKGQWTQIDTKLYSPIAQGIVVLKGPKTNKEHAKAFHTFIFSKEAQKILSNFGYSIDE